MPDEFGPAGWSVTDALSTRLHGREALWDGRFRSRLTAADYVSLVALFFGWVAALLFLSNEPNWAITVTFVAFFFDKLDGYVARRTGESSPFGRQVDSFIDIFAYLVTAALLFHYALAPSFAASVVVGFLILSFGGLRLVRHNDEGFVSEGGTNYYHGTTVVHTNVVVVANYLLSSYLPVWNPWFAVVTTALVCPLMVSNYRSPKTDTAHALAALATVVATALVLALELA
ncbi:phosphatidylserine synthase [Halobacteriales archaeon SW_6_65_15]|jgi:CDP-diacylglycerol--serine O-phosphatidyltransferase|nr:MAG: phosphatidylserine synthase [Halobacteriales archaeon SW_6_65_15]